MTNFGLIFQNLTARWRFLDICRTVRNHCELRNFDLNHTLICLAHNQRSYDYYSGRNRILGNVGGGQVSRAL